MAKRALDDTERMQSAVEIEGGTENTRAAPRPLSSAHRPSLLRPQHSPLVQFAKDVATGLSDEPKHLPCKYLYDDTGSKLFCRIMDLDEYYPTRCETEILDRHKEEIASIVGERVLNLIELGAGDGKKTRILLRHFLDRGLSFRYVPIDICASAIEGLTDELATHFQDLAVEGLVTEYFEGINWLSRLDGHANFVLFLGSNIGNFTPVETAAFLSGLWNAMNDQDFLLIGFDLKKDARMLNEAYDDALGVTAQFNMNLLARINSELGGSFDLDRFQYYTTYNPRAGAVESFLVSRARQEVHIERCGKTFSFSEWESVHTESSYKFLSRDLPRLAGACGFQQVASFSDSKGYFTDSLWRVVK